MNFMRKDQTVEMSIPMELATHFGAVSVGMFDNRVVRVPLRWANSRMLHQTTDCGRFVDKREGIRLLPHRP